MHIHFVCLFFWTLLHVSFNCLVSIGDRNVSIRLSLWVNMFWMCSHNVEYNIQHPQSTSVCARTRTWIGQMLIDAFRHRIQFLILDMLLKILLMLARELLLIHNSNFQPHETIHSMITIYSHLHKPEAILNNSQHNICVFYLLEILASPWPSICL